MPRYRVEKNAYKRVIKELSENYKEFNENYSSMKKYIETIKKNQSEVKTTIFEMKNALEGTVVWIGWMKQRVESAIWKTR